MYNIFGPTRQGAGGSRYLRGLRTKKRALEEELAAARAANARDFPDATDAELDDLVSPIEAELWEVDEMIQTYHEQVTDVGDPPGRGRRENPSCSPRSYTRRDNYAGSMVRYTRALTLGDLVDVEPEVEVSTVAGGAGGAGGRGRGGLRAGAYPQVPCPRPTQDLKLNTRNRDSAIRSKHIQYGPLNLSDERFWRRLAKHWNTTPRVAKESRCGNCVAFDVSPRMLRCMPGEISDGHGWLGYCWMHHFKCHSARTCRTWASGGPIVDDAVSLDWQRRASGV